MRRTLLGRGYHCCVGEHIPQSQVQLFLWHGEVLRQHGRELNQTAGRLRPAREDGSKGLRKTPKQPLDTFDDSVA